MIFLGMRSAEFFPSARLVESEQLALFPFQILLRSLPRNEETRLWQRTHRWHAIDQPDGGRRGEFSVPRVGDNKILMGNGNEKQRFSRLKAIFCCTSEFSYN
jgi:hypothetical protein